MMTSPNYQLLRLIIFLIAIIVSSQSLANNCPSPCECDDETLIVKCGSGTLDVLPITLNPSVQHLTINNNLIKTIDSSLQFYYQLTYLDLSYNNLFRIPSKSFGNQNKLQSLHLNNNKLGAINNKTFFGLSNLTTLNLRGNYLVELEYGTFTPLINIQELNLGNNRIVTIDDHAFDGLNNLKVLWLDDNQLTKVPSTIFHQLPRLAELYLGINSFTNIQPNAFIDLKHLNTLSIKGAALNNFTMNIFNGLMELKVLDITDIRLDEIPTDELSKLNRLEELSIGQNLFESVPTDAFKGLTNLRKLDISGSMKLNRIEQGAFNENKNLETISLTANEQLDTIDEYALHGLPHLRYLILRNNGFKTITATIIPFGELYQLDLSENPLNCDCRILWLNGVLTNQNLTSQQGDGVICASPENLKDRPLKQLTADTVGCTFAAPSNHVMISLVVVVTAAILTALVLIYCRCRKRLGEMLKTGFGTKSLGSKEQEYQKTCSDEDYMTRYNTHATSIGLNSNMTSYHQPSPCMRPIPSTEL